MQPQKLTDIQPGESAKLSVQADGINLSYCWYRNDEPIVNSDRVQITSDRSTSTLKIKNVQTSSDDGSYVCKITNPTGGSVETHPAKLNTSKQTQIFRFIVQSINTKFCIRHGCMKAFL